MTTLNYRVAAREDTTTQAPMLTQSPEAIASIPATAASIVYKTTTTLPDTATTPLPEAPVPMHETTTPMTEETTSSIPVINIEVSETTTAAMLTIATAIPDVTTPMPQAITTAPPTMNVALPDSATTFGTSTEAIPPISTTAPDKATPAAVISTTATTTVVTNPNTNFLIYEEGKGGVWDYDPSYTSIPSQASTNPTQISTLQNDVDATPIVISTDITASGDDTSNKNVAENQTTTTTSSPTETTATPPVNPLYQHDVPCQGCPHPGYIVPLANLMIPQVTETTTVAPNQLHEETTSPTMETTTSTMETTTLTKETTTPMETTTSTMETTTPTMETTTNTDSSLAESTPNQYTERQQQHANPLPYQSLLTKVVNSAGKAMDAKADYVNPALPMTKPTLKQILLNEIQGPSAANTILNNDTRFDFAPQTSVSVKRDQIPTQIVNKRDKSMSLTKLLLPEAASTTSAIFDTDLKDSVKDPNVKDYTINNLATELATNEVMPNIGTSNFNEDNDDVLLNQRESVGYETEPEVNEHRRGEIVETPWLASYGADENESNSYFRTNRKSSGKRDNVPGALIESVGLDSNSVPSTYENFPITHRSDVAYPTDVVSANYHPNVMDIPPVNDDIDWGKELTVEKYLRDKKTRDKIPSVHSYMNLKIDEPYPNFLKKEYFPNSVTFDNIDTDTQILPEDDDKYRRKRSVR